MCALCICAPRNQNNSALWSNITWSQLFLNEDHWNCIFKLKHTFRILLLVYFCFESIPLHIIFSGCVFNFSSILIVKYTYFWENFFTSTEVWRSMLKVHFNIWSINEIHWPLIYSINFILVLNYKWIILLILFSHEKHIYKYTWSILTCKVYFISVRALQILQAPHSKQGQPNINWPVVTVSVHSKEIWLLKLRNLSLNLKVSNMALV